MRHDSGDSPAEPGPDDLGPTPGPPEEEPPRRTGQLLLDRTVGSYFAARLLAAIGVWIHNVVAAVVVYQATRSAVLVGVVSMVQFGPQVLLATWTGAMADRGNRRVQAVIGYCITTLGAGSLAVWMAFGGGGPLNGAGPVIAAAFIVGVGFVTAGPPSLALVPSLARPSELSRVVAITTSPLTIARASGPALGALLLILGGPAMAFAVVAATQLVLAIVLARINLRPTPMPAERDTSLLGGLRHVRKDRTLAVLLIAVVGVGFGVDPVITLSPSIADGFGAGTELVAMMGSAFGLGAGLLVLLLGPLDRRLGRARLGSMGLAVLAGSMVALALSPGPATAVASVFIGGMGMMASVTSFSTQIQARVPEMLRGRIMALWSVCFVGSRPLAAALNGALADIWAPELALLVLAVLLAATATFARPSVMTRSLRAHPSM